MIVVAGNLCHGFTTRSAPRKAPVMNSGASSFMEYAVLTFTGLSRR